VVENSVVLIQGALGVSLTRGILPHGLSQVARYGWRTSLADVYFVALMRLWLSNLALSYRWSYLGVVAGVLSAAVCVVKAAEFELWALPQVRDRQTEPSRHVVRRSHC
jgi:hypothetical protein